MNIELDEVVVQDVSDDALELAAGRYVELYTGYCSINTLACGIPGAC